MQSTNQNKISLVLIFILVIFVLSQNSLTGKVFNVNKEEFYYGFYAIDGFSTLYLAGNAVSKGHPTFDNDLAIDIELVKDGYYILDQYGKIYNYGEAKNYGDFLFEEKIFRDLELTSEGYYALDGYGNIYLYGNAIFYGKPSLADKDIFVDMEVTKTGEGYYILNKYGKLYNFGVS